MPKGNSGVVGRSDKVREQGRTGKWEQEGRRASAFYQHDEEGQKQELE
jgi:hypothetical protein